MKKSLSILLALLMILSSLPIMATTASAEEATAAAETTDPNLLAGYTAEDFGKWRWNSISDNTSIAKGDDTSDILVKFPGSQNIFTTANLDANTVYKFSFDWYSKNVDGGKAYPAKVDVFPVEEGVNVFDTTQYKVFDASNYNTATEDDIAAYEKNVWYEGIMPTGYGTDKYPDGTRYNGYLPDLYDDNVYGVDLVTSQSLGDQVSESWQNASADFTSGEAGEYIIIVGFGSAGGVNTEQELYAANFRLIDKADSASIAIEDKIACDWYIPANAKIYDDFSLTQDGITSDYRYERPTWQKLSTAVTLEPNTKYIFSFDYYAEKHTSHNPFVSNVAVYSADKGVILDADAWDGETYIGNTKNLATCLTGYGSADKAGTWQHVTLEFTTTEFEKYNILIQHSSADASGSASFHNDQKIYYANFKIDGFVASKPGNILNNACNANGDVTWTVDTGNMRDLDPRNFAGGLDNPAFSINGGYAWGFGFAGANLSGDNFAYFNIKANGLKAGKTYDFSYINRVQFRFVIDSIKCGDNAVTNYIVAPAYENVESPDGKAAQKTSALFTVPVDGDYVITLKANRDSAYHMPGIEWSTTYLCDLELYVRGAMYNVSVSKDGNGAVKADKTGLTEEGTVVTFEARPEIYERFLGWYVGDELVSEESVYTTTVAGELNPIAKFTAYSENLMANYNTSNFVARYWGSIQEGESRYGGNGIRAYNVPHQRAVTKINLEAGKEYTLSFDWRALENISNKELITGIYVQKILSPEIDILGNKDATWGDGTGYKGTLGEDIENGGGYTSQEIANTCTWQNITTKFTPAEAGEYAIIICFGHDSLPAEQAQAIRANNSDRIVNPSRWDNGYKSDGTHDANNDQSVDLSDFVLKTAPVIEYTGTKYDWNGVHWSEVTDSADTYKGGYAYKVAKAMSQNINTTLTLKPGTKYRYSFNWKAVDNAKGLAYVQSSSIYSANSGDPTKGNKTNYEWYNEADAAGYTPIYIPNEGYANLMTNVSNPNGGKETEDSVLKGWNTYSATFTTIEDEEYYLFINFGLKGSIGNQDVIISDVVIEEVAQGTAPAGDAMISHPGVSIRKASESAFGQALRFKFTVAGNVIANAQADGYELVEYGTVVALADELVGHAADPILGATSYTVRTGVAYNKDNGTNIQFAVDTEGNVTYTAALYNIPTDNYASSIAVRPYAKFRNANGETYVRYGTTRIASVFDVAKAVLEGADADDIAYVNSTLLAGDIRAAYEAWLAK